ncbi:hypothetical protein HN419_00800 [Candidatus Woesearchaeota archaeon]|nr:hypothetical protein [Candidatus Woesearchaeota archaeon]MBT3537464.1 hypothetical protein [Candidatus Woesearchaeota archaeon]MBT4717339.1 hypothetical protein [Candidatus Woesearchaeota archaeon]MBT7106226.1 hypothetical protein [Candidatus Woesearchaeota archaeon]MBT7930876.1 hypothetical protein [Candidatus Woesearchaeota archaeon]
MKSKKNCFIFSFLMALLDFFIVTLIFQDEWNLLRAVIVGLSVALIFQLNAIYQK